MDMWKHVSKPFICKSKMMTANSVIKALRSQHMSSQSSEQKLFIPVKYRTFALNLSKGFLRLWSLLYFPTFYYYLTLSLGQKMTLLPLEIPRSKSWLIMIRHFWKKHGYDVTKIPSKWICLEKYFSNVAKQP